MIAATRLLWAQLALDARNLRRDVLLGFLTVFPFVIALIYRFVIPDQVDLERLAQGALPPGLEAHRAAVEMLAAGLGPVLMGLFAGLNAGLIGSVYGLLLADERDERTLAAVRVMPRPFVFYMAMRMLAPVGLTTVVTVAAYPLAGLAPLPLATVAVIALAGATIAPLVALLILAYAPNKLAALVLMRLATVTLALPALAYFAAPGWERLAWPVPSYWQMKALWLAAEGEAYWPALLLAPALSLPLTFWLYRELSRRSER